MRLLVLVTITFHSIGAQPGPKPVAPDIQNAVTAFLASLNEAQRAKALIPFNNAERLNWHYVPTVRAGVALKELTSEQKTKAVDLLRVMLSQTGFDKVQTIRRLEDVLKVIEQGEGPVRDPDLHYVAVFGQPSTLGAWGLRYEGHHVSLNWTIVDDVVIASTPQFLGANPADVKDGPMRGTRVLRAEEDLGRALVQSLNEAQRGQAILNPTAPPDILTGHEREAAIQEDRGVAFRDLSSDQQGLLLNLIEEVAKTQTDALAQDRLARLRAGGLDTIKFAWMGGFEKGQGHYYRVQGPSFLIEYDNTQNAANHIHSVWRDFKGDFGEDILREHYEEYADPAHPKVHEH